jgi:hypothetical protein
VPQGNLLQLYCLLHWGVGLVGYWSFWYGKVWKGCQA